MSSSDTSSASAVQYACQWMAVTALTAALCWVAVLPQPCWQLEACHQHLTSYPTVSHKVSAYCLVAMMIYEVVTLIATYLGSRDAQALVPNLRSRCMPSFLMAVMLAVLAVTEFMFSSTDWTLAHVMPNSDGFTMPGRPVYTHQYIEWCINVPILLLLAGCCALDRPLQQIGRPLVVTNVYVILCWTATVATSACLKWALITISLSMYAFASRDMLRWVHGFKQSAPAELPSRGLRPWLSSGLVAYLLLYGAVFLSSAFGLIDASTERSCFLALTMGSKIMYSLCFVIIRSDEYHKTLTDILKKVSTSNVAMISILRGSFDIIVPCILDAHGRCKFPWSLSGDMSKLETILGRPVGGVNLKELLEEKEAMAFSAYVRNVVRQAESPHAFSEVKLSTQGTWSCDAVEMPPIAQVLNCKMPSMAGGIRSQILEATIHLSVVPRSTVNLTRKELQLIAAIQIRERGDATESALDLAGPCFEAFDAQKASTTASTRTGSSSSGSGDDKPFQGIVASLADLTKLGVTSLFQRSLSGSEQGDDETSSFQYPRSSASEESLSHLGAFALLQKDESDTAIVGTWEGTVSNALGGYEQRIEFKDERSVIITVMGQTLEGRCKMDCSKEPAQLDITVLPKGTSCLPPPIPYIFKIEAGHLHLCGPSDSKMDRPTGFDGHGLCIMHPADAEDSMPRLITGSEIEPDPEFSRRSTEEVKAISSEEIASHANLQKRDVISTLEVMQDADAQKVVGLLSAFALGTVLFAGLRRSR